MPTPPASGAWQRRADRYRGVAGPLFRMPVGVLVALGTALVAAWLPVRVGMGLDAAFFFAIGTYCAANFWRCREAHCVITGTGWTATGLAAVVAAIGEYPWNHRLWIAFVTIWAAGIVFELVVRQRTGSTALH